MGNPGPLVTVTPWGMRADDWPVAVETYEARCDCGAAVELIPATVPFWRCSKCRIALSVVRTYEPEEG